MALWDQRDARWQVEERDDGSNVNGWHWEERNRVQWSRDRLTALLTPLPATGLDAALGTATITQLKSLTGEAYQTMRKGNKKFAVFDLQVTLAWEGRWVDGDVKVKGDVQLREFSSVNDPDEYTFEVTAEQPKKDDKLQPEQLDVARDSLRAAIAALQEAVFERLDQYRQELGNL